MISFSYSSYLTLVLSFSYFPTLITLHLSPASMTFLLQLLFCLFLVLNLLGFQLLPHSITFLPNYFPTQLLSHLHSVPNLLDPQLLNIQTYTLLIILMVEQPDWILDKNNTASIGSINHRLVVDGSTWCSDVLDTRTSSSENIVREWEKCI